MIKLNVATPMIDSEDNLVEVNKEVILHYSAKSIMLYEQNTKSKFFTDYSEAIKAVDFGKLQNLTDVSPDEEMNLGLELLANDKVNTFLLNAIPALYARIKDGRFVQTDITYAEAMESDWLVSLVNINTFGLIIGELSKNAGNGPTDKQPKKK